MKKKTDEETTITVAPNGAIARWKNKKVILIEDKEGFLIQFRSVIGGDISIPACSYKVHRNKMRQTTIKLSDNAIEALMMSWLSYKKSKQFPNETRRSHKVRRKKG